MIKWIKKLFRCCDHEWIEFKYSNFYKEHYVEFEDFYWEYNYFCKKCAEMK